MGFAEVRHRHLAGSSRLEEVLRRLPRLPDEAAQAQQARDVCAAAVQALWAWDPRSHCLTLQAPPPQAEGSAPDKDARTAGQALAECAWHLGAADAAHLVGETYTRLLPANLRTRTGAFYTPPALTRIVLERCVAAGVDLSDATCIDPAAGAGAFLVPIAEAIAEALEPVGSASTVRAIQRCVRGFEIDPFAAWMANVFVELAVLEQVVESGLRVGQLVTAADTLQADLQPIYDLVIGNPPFGRAPIAPVVRERFADGLYGHANLYGLFMHAAVELCAPSGVIALITPTSFLGGRYFSNLRALLARRAAPASLDLLTDRRGVFRDVLQETAISLFRKGGTEGTAIVRSTAVPAGPGATQTMLGTLKLPAQPDRPWILPGRRSGPREDLSSFTSSLSGWGYRVRTGPLVWNRFRTAISDRRDGTPIIWADAIRPDGSVATEPSRRRRHMSHIRLSDDHSWMICTAPCVLVQRTTAKEQKRRLVAGTLDAATLARNPNGVVVENHVNVIVADARPQVQLEVLTAFLNTQVADSIFRRISGSVAVSAYELECMPLPHPASLDRLAHAVRAGDHARVEAEAEALLNSD